MRKTN